MNSIENDRTFPEIDICNTSSSPGKFTASTPQSMYKPRVNFHSIASLASASLTPISSPSNSYQNHDDTDYNSSISSFREHHPAEKKPRRKFSDWQVWYLRQIYAQNRYPSPADQEQIACQLRLPTSSIRIWFQNSRARYGKK